MQYSNNAPEQKKNHAKRIAFINSVLILMVVAFFFGYTYTLEKVKKEKSALETSQSVSQNVEAPSDENNKTKTEKIIEPGSQIDITYNYSCGHSVEKIEPVWEEFSGKSKNEIEAVHTNCIVESISPKISVMSIYLQEICNNHYMVKLEGNYIKAYNKNSPEKAEKKMKVDRTMLYEEDIKILEAGVEVASMEELLEFLENFSS
ncbi:MAG: hypothetical protein IJC74_08850 [Clostridia bacterium]|nr:hypothetical protein [Clostridia bacterium]